MYFEAFPRLSERCPRRRFSWGKWASAGGGSVVIGVQGSSYWGIRHPLVQQFGMQQCCISVWKEGNIQPREPAWLSRGRLHMPAHRGETSTGLSSVCNGKSGLWRLCGKTKGFKGGHSGEVKTHTDRWCPDRSEPELGDLPFFVFYSPPEVLAFKFYNEAGGTHSKLTDGNFWPSTDNFAVYPVIIHK